MYPLLKLTHRSSSNTAATNTNTNTNTSITLILRVVLLSLSSSTHLSDTSLVDPGTPPEPARVGGKLNPPAEALNVELWNLVER